MNDRGNQADMPPPHAAKPDDNGPDDSGPGDSGPGDSRKPISLCRRRFMAAGMIGLAPPAWAGPAAPPALADYEHASGGRIGVYARNMRTGTELAWRADERFVMCSTFKASVAACTLARVDRGEDSLAARVAFGPGDLLEYAPVARKNLARGALPVGEMCQGAVEWSDNTCANLLLARIGGPAALTRFWRQACGDTISRLDHNEPMLNRAPPGDPHDTTTPRAMAGNLHRLLLGDVLTPASRGRLAEWMENCRTGANRLRGGLPANWRIGDKTGNNGHDAFGDIAIAWPRPDTPIVICAYTQGGHPAPQEVATLFAAIGQAAARLATT
ncbi:class A beta-lactamase [Nguyenibacter vanlangensis]|nr:class A beta-lactamase [Nguyenibacter vanlangensis]